MFTADLGPIVFLMVLVWIVSAVFGTKKPPPGQEKPGTTGRPKGLADVLRQIEAELRKQAGGEREADESPAAIPPSSPRATKAAAQATAQRKKAAPAKPARPISLGTATASEHAVSRSFHEITASEHEISAPSARLTAIELRTRKQVVPRKKIKVLDKAPTSSAAAVPGSFESGDGIFSRIGAGAPDAVRAFVWSEIFREPSALRSDTPGSFR